MASIPARVTQLLASIVGLDETDLAILCEISRHTRNRIKAIPRTMSHNVHLCERAIRYRLSKLAKIGLVQRIGQRKGWLLQIPATNPL